MIVAPAHYFLVDQKDRSDGNFPFRFCLACLHERFPHPKLSNSSIHGPPGGRLHLHRASQLYRQRRRDLKQLRLEAFELWRPQDLCRDVLNAAGVRIIFSFLSDFEIHYPRSWIVWWDCEVLRTQLGGDSDKGRVGMRGIR